MTSFLEQQGVRLAFQSDGSGQPVLFIQGVGTPGQGWKPQVEGLKSEFRCIRFDHRGIGESGPAEGRLSVETMAQDALAVLDACHEESAHVVGHSLGGLIALQLARVQPRRVRSLSLLCTFADGRAVGPLSWHLVWYGLRSKLGTRAMRRRAFLHLILPRDLLRSHSPNELAEQYGHHFARDLADTPAITSRQLQAMRRTDLTAFLGELAFIPTLVMSASEDPIAPPRLGRAIADGIPGARFLEVPAASHALPLHNADWVNETLRSHLRSAETRAH